jgi:energy-coupling factor transporter transmembrane protein EcfT
MRTSLHEVWGCAHGPVVRLAPPTRMMAGAALFAGCMVAPSATAPGSVFIGAVSVGWMASCAPPWRLVRWTALLAIVLFLTYLLLLPLIPAGSTGSGWRPRMIIAWSLWLRGMGGLLISFATVTTLSAGDLREGLVRLPIPGIVSSILVQIVHQTATLAYETRRIAAAMAVRGAGTGLTTSWRVLTSIPSVWLPRILIRAERVAAAMELRGYCEGGLRSFHPLALGRSDAATLALALATLGAAVFMRILHHP